MIYHPWTYCHTRAQLSISAYLIIISDDKLGPHSGIIIGLIRPAGQPTTRCNNLKLHFFLWFQIQIFFFRSKVSQGLISLNLEVKFRIFKFRNLKFRNFQITNFQILNFQIPIFQVLKFKLQNFKFWNFKFRIFKFQIFKVRIF